ncbi:MAG: SET domain-containing protein [bacterium]|nr:SET domain-containing protein [bacterium]
MLLRKTKLGLSQVQGTGLFADEYIFQGEVVGINNENFSIIRYSKEGWKKLEKNLSRESFKQIKRYAYKDKDDGLYCLNLDDTRFINHSKNPNIETKGGHDLAIRDIKKGEEILIDYTTFYDPDYFNEIIQIT